MSLKRIIGISFLSVFGIMAVFFAGFLAGYEFHRDLMNAVDKGVTQGIAQAWAR